MKDSASLAPQMLHPEQDLSPKTDEKPWLRQKNEPALWFMRFQIYKKLGSKRTMQAAIDADTGKAKQEKAQTKNVSIPGSWSRAAKQWNWKERASAYDLAEQAKQASYLRNTANQARFASKAYRIITLDWMARTLQEEMQRVTMLKDRHAAMGRLQSVMRDLAREMEGLEGVILDACDAAAFKTIREEIEKRGK